MSNDGIRIGVGTRVLFDGQLWEVSELLPAAKGTEVVLRAYGRHSEVVRISLREILEGQRARLCGEGAGPYSDDMVDPADVVLSAMTNDERDAIRQRAAHIREVLTGFRSGSADFAEAGEPRAEYASGRSLTARYAAKALELDVCVRTVQYWAADFLAYGEAGLARSAVTRREPTGRADDRWIQTALEVMVEHVAVRLRPPPLDPTRLAASLSATLLMVNSRIKAPVAHRLLDSVAPWRTTTHYLRTLAHQRHWPETRAALIRLADHLHHYDVPINYQRRRSLDYTALLPEETWIAICTDLDIRCGGSERLRLMRCHLYTTISGNPVDRAPWLRDTNEFRSAFFRFPLLLTPTLHTALEDNAATFLRDNGIDEPLTWHPPLDLVAELSLPGADPDRLPLATIHRMVRHGQSLTAIAEHLNTTADAVRYALTVYPAPTHQRGPTARPAPLVSSLAEQLSAAELRNLYQHQRMSLRQIAARHHTSRQVVAALARRHGITLRPPQREPVLPTVDRDWLHTQYVHHRRTLPELAAEKNMSTANMARWAHHHQIPLRSRGSPSHIQMRMAHTAADTAPALLRPVLVGISGTERLTRFAAASRYPSITAAAAARGIHQGVLQHQINRLAIDLGGALLTRAQRNHPMTTTPLGRRVLRAWHKWTEEIEAATRPS